MTKEKKLKKIKLCRFLWGTVKKLYCSIFSSNVVSCIDRSVLKNYEIIKTKGVGEVLVPCPQNKTVLGCGVLSGKSYKTVFFTEKYKYK